MIGKLHTSWWPGRGRTVKDEVWPSRTNPHWPAFSGPHLLVSTPFNNSIKPRTYKGTKTHRWGQSPHDPVPSQKPPPLPPPTLHSIFTYGDIFYLNCNNCELISLCGVGLEPEPHTYQTGTLMMVNPVCIHVSTCVCRCTCVCEHKYTCGGQRTPV